jgi:hypothetical protein
MVRSLLRRGRLGRDGDHQSRRRHSGWRTFYRYIGAAISANLSTTANFNTLYNSSPAAFAKVAGATGTVYQYNGPAGSVDLYNTDYTGANWTALTPTQVTPVVSAGTGGITVNAANAAQLDAEALVATATNGAALRPVTAFGFRSFTSELFLFNVMRCWGPIFANPILGHCLYVHDYGGWRRPHCACQRSRTPVNNAAVADSSALHATGGLWRFHRLER